MARKKWDGGLFKINRFSPEKWKRWLDRFNNPPDMSKQRADIDHFREMIEDHAKARR